MASTVLWPGTYAEETSDLDPGSHLQTSKIGRVTGIQWPVQGNLENCRSTIHGGLGARSCIRDPKIFSACGFHGSECTTETM